MPPLTANRALTNHFLGRFGVALLLLFSINTVFGLLPLQLRDPAWQLRIADLLRTTAPFALLGTALIFLCEALDGKASPAWFPVKRIQRLAPLAALGFVLLIPLQINASWVQIRTADAEAQQTIRSVERRVADVRGAASREELIALTQGLPADWQPLPGDSLAVNRSRLLARVEPELARLRSVSETNKSAAIQKRLQDGLRDLLLSLVYAAAFFGTESLKLGALTGKQGWPNWSGLFGKKKSSRRRRSSST